LSALCWAIQEHGGYILGLRGDGVFAFFGDPGHTKHHQLAAFAVGATGWAIEAIESEVNPRLRQRGIEPVQVRAGMDFGEVTFVKVGTAFGCEVNPIGFTANFAAKCGKIALAWEIVCGQGMAELLPERYLDRRGEEANKYERGGFVQRYQHYYVEWESFVEHMDLIDRQLDGYPASSIVVG
jgi:adenylate cyclase